MGFKRSLGFADLYDLPPFVQSGNVVPRFLSKWNQNEIPKSSPKKSSTPPAVKVPSRCIMMTIAEPYPANVLVRKSWTFC